MFRYCALIPCGLYDEYGLTHCSKNRAKKMLRIWDLRWEIWLTIIKTRAYIMLSSRRKARRRMVIQLSKVCEWLIFTILLLVESIRSQFYILPLSLHYQNWWSPYFLYRYFSMSPSLCHCWEATQAFINTAMGVTVRSYHLDHGSMGLVNSKRFMHKHL